MTRILSVVSTVGIAILLGLTWWAGTDSWPFGAKSDDKYAQCRTSTVVGGAGSLGGALELVDASGQTVTDKDIFTEPTLLYFGYTFCPDVCPMDTVRNAEAVDLLAEQGYVATPAFISIDPERDTPEVVGEFAEAVHPKMIGLTGSLEQIKAASKTYRTYYNKQDAEDEYYLVDHSTMTYLVMPNEGYVEFFRRDVPPESMAKTVACFMDRAS